MVVFCKNHWIVTDIYLIFKEKFSKMFDIGWIDLPSLWWLAAPSIFMFIIVVIAVTLKVFHDIDLAVSRQHIALTAQNDGKFIKETRVLPRKINTTGKPRRCKVPLQALEDMQQEVEELLVDRLIGLETSVSELNIHDLQRNTPSVSVHMFRSFENNEEEQHNGGVLRKVMETSLFTPSDLMVSAQPQQSSQHEQQQQQQQEPQQSQPRRRQRGRARKALRFLRKKIIACVRPRTRQ